MGGRKTPLSSFQMESLDATVCLFVLTFVIIVVACDALERLYFKKNPHDRFKD